MTQTLATNKGGRQVSLADGDRSRFRDS